MYNFKDSFLQLKKLTNDFKKIGIDTLRDSKNFLILRLVCNLTHHKLTEIYKGKFNKTVRFTPYEYGKIKVGKKVGGRLSEIFRQNLPEKVNFSVIEEKFLTMQKRTKLTHGVGRVLEEKVESILLRKNIKFEKNISIKGKSNISIDVDFIIPSRLTPKIAIECKVWKSFSGSFGYWYIKSMIVNAIELSSKKIKFIAVIDGIWTKNSLTLLKNYCDVIQENELQDLPQIIHKKLSA